MVTRSPKNLHIKRVKPKKHLALKITGSVFLGVLVIAGLFLFFQQDQLKRWLVENQYVKEAKSDAAHQKKLLISGWSAPPITGNAAEDARRYQEVKAAGFNNIIGLVDPEDTSLGDQSPARLALQASQKAGLTYIVQDPGVQGLVAANISSAVSPYKSMPAFYGNVVFDEPGQDKFEALSQVQKAYKKAVPNKLPYVNLLPNVASPEQLQSGAAAPYSGPASDEQYRTYVQSYLDQVKPTSISFSRFPLMVSGLSDTYLRNIEVIAQETGKKKIDFWPFIQTMGFAGNYREPTAAEIDWQVYTNLAFGAKAIQYFCYWTPLANDRETFQPAMINLDGTETSIYTAVKTTNLAIRTFENLYLNFNWKGTIAYAPEGTTPQIQATIDALQGKSYKSQRIEGYLADQPMLIGAMKDKNGLDGFLVTNYAQADLGATNHIDLTFKKAKRVILSLGGKKEVKALQAGRLHLDLPPGQGAFLIPIS